MDIFLTLAIVVLALICFIGEWLPVDITAIAVMVTLMALGLVTPQEGISGFGNSATITVMAMFIISAGIAKTGAISNLSDVLLNLGGKRCQRQILAMGAILAPISAFINNTAIVAIFLPVVEQWCKKQGISPSKLLIPLSYISILGGMITVIGTSTNVLASGLSEQLGYGAFSLFQFTKLGLISATVGLIYLVIAAPRLLPARKNPNNNLLTQSDRHKDYICELVIKPRSKIIGHTLSSSNLQRKFDVEILEMVRHDCHFLQPLEDKVLLAGDILIVRGTRKDILKIRDSQGIDILSNVQFNDRVASNLKTHKTEGIAEVLILANSTYIGSTLSDLNFCQRYNAIVLAIRRGEELVRSRLSQIPLCFGDILLLQGPIQSLVGLQTNKSMLVIDSQELPPFRFDKAGTAISIALGVIAIAALNILPIMVSALIGVILMVVTDCLKPAELYEVVRWDIIFLLAGLIPLGVAMQNSGATQWLANHLFFLGSNLSGYWLLTFFFIITALITEILSNNASVVLILPIAVEVAKNLNLNPFAFMFAVTFAASNSFMTPLGYQTNTMVYSAGGYKFWDFIKVGAPLTILMTIIVPPLIILLYGL
ncbi:MAG: SLC13 family permease [Pleurocapsa sp.]